MLLWSGFKLIYCLLKRGLMNLALGVSPEVKIQGSQVGRTGRSLHQSLVCYNGSVKRPHWEYEIFIIFSLEWKSSINNHDRLCSFDHNAFQSLSLRFHTFCSIVALKVFIHPKTLRFWALFWMGRVSLFRRLWKKYLFENHNICTNNISIFRL